MPAAAGEYVWLEPKTKGEFDVPIGAKILSVKGGQIRLKDDNGKELTLPGNTKLRPMHVTSVDGLDDMINLGDLHEEGILHNLHMRYENNKIYTYTGSILVAVNPYKDLPIYSTDLMRSYQNRAFSDMPPHVFAIGDNAYQAMMRNQVNQCIIISGESGAGKTESTKFILKFLATVSGRHSSIEKQILDANPIMEAFGNAKTIRNDNSSRFGKYIDIHFNFSGAIEGAKIDQYLLEKSRIVQQTKDERNYHIFYCMLAGMSDSEKKKLGLTNPKSYKYLSGGSFDCHGRNDKIDYEEILDACKTLMFSKTEIFELMKILAGLLHLGNIIYSKKMDDNLEGATITDKLSLNSVATIFDVKVDDLSQSLTHKTIFTGTDSVTSPLRVDQAMDVRDAFVKGIYGKMFIWIIDKINEAIYRPTNPDDTRGIGVLDIFGFENFGKNSFEQMCINYANENLQQFFVRHIFKLEQTMYDNEGISWKNIKFTDNQHILDLIAEKPLNIIALVDEETKFPKGTDLTMLEKLHSNHQRNPDYLLPKSSGDKSFGIRHFAGDVFYHSDGFLDKNRDTFSQDLLWLLQSTKSSFLRKLFSNDLDTLINDPTGTETKRRTPTLGAQFKKSLDVLMTNLSKCQPFFVRCVKPNEVKKPIIFDRELAVRQLRYSGMMETIRVRRAGYPIRHTFAEFVDRYRMCCDGINPSFKERDCKSASKKICVKVLKNGDYQLGKTKVFLKDSQDSLMEKAREEAIAQKIEILQLFIKAWAMRKIFLKLNGGMEIIQNHWRMYKIKRQFDNVQNGFMKVQSIFHSRNTARRYFTLLMNLIKIQSQCRGYLARSNARLSYRSLLELQAAIKGHLVRKYYGKELKHLKKLEELEYKKENDFELNRSSMEESEALSKAEKSFYKGVKVIDKDLEEWQMENKKKTEKVQLLLELLSRKQDGDKTVNKELSEIFGFLQNTQNDDEDNDEEEEEEIEEIEEIKQFTADVSDHLFKKFAKTHFGKDVTSSYERRMINNSLLNLQAMCDKIGALATWINILRFMGDISDVAEDTQKLNDDPAPIITRIYSTIGRKLNEKHLIEAQKYMGKISTEKPNRRATKQINATAQGDNKKVRQGNPFIQERVMTNLEKVHFITSMGILRPELRDEIYCQICKQLTKNPDKRSFARGWVLLTMCICCFIPTDRFILYLRKFIMDGPVGYRSFCEDLLKRTFKNGTRDQPSSYIELHAVCTKEPIILPIQFVNGHSKTLYADSASSAKEICTALCDKIGLVDRFGFALYISMDGSKYSIGNGCNHVMDIISKAEQATKEKGSGEATAAWNILFRKEIFKPWHSASDDPISTNLIYEQIVRGVKYGEYSFDSDQEFAKMAAQQLYIDIGSEFDSKRLLEILPELIPNKASKTSVRDLSKWKTLITDEFKKGDFVLNDVGIDRTKEDIVNFAKFKWPLLFSRFEDAHQISGPKLLKKQVKLAINWTGIYFIDDREQVLKEIPYAEITGISSSESTRINRIFTQNLSIFTVSGDQYVFEIYYANELRELIVMFLEGLRERSRYLIAIKDSDSSDVEDIPNPPKDLLNFRRGDLIIMQIDNDGELKLKKNSWTKGEHERTKETGNFHSSAFYRVPTMMKPAPEILKQFAIQSMSQTDTKNGKRNNDYEINEEDLREPYTLENFSYEYFRPPVKTTSFGRRHVEKLSMHQRDPLRNSLLKKINAKQSLNDKGIDIFESILQYCGDISTKAERKSVELTDEIFSVPLENELIRDEMYCQMMKQLTNNKSITSEERAWELLYLATGMMLPSTLVEKELATFLKSRPKEKIANECFQRLLNVKRLGNRKFPPHLTEVEAIQDGSYIMYHKVFFPNDKDEEFDVTSTTRAKDISSQLVDKLNLASTEGFSLFIKVKDKVISIPRNDYFFDFVRHLTDFMKGNSNEKIAYMIFFMKKLWINVSPDEDTVADRNFYFYQERPKYLKGHHNATEEDVIKLGVLLYRINSKEEEFFGDTIEDKKDDFIPKNYQRQKKIGQWIKLIEQKYESLQNMSKSEAKSEFVRVLSTMSTFGCAFFDAKIRGQSYGLPSIILLGINSSGLMIMDAKDNSLLAEYPFTKILSWKSSSSKFVLSVKESREERKLTLETRLGYRIDDLLTSYVSKLMNTQK
ncbi:hypothetical protein SNEBB_000798 [Seison nebaliae]|nr:hypothetical protein SNEBB_000798 [Seison nebaliae]